MYINPKSKEIQKIFDRLVRYPVVKVDPKMAQSFSRQKKIRYLSKNGDIYIRKGIISIPDGRKLLKKQGKYVFEYW